MKSFFFGALIIISFSIKAQPSQLPDLGSYAILAQAGGFSGSGFYMFDSSYASFYFITAAHVLANPQTKVFYSDSLYLVSYRENSQKDRKDRLRISLSNAYRRGKLLIDHTLDVAVLKLANVVSNLIDYDSSVTKISQYGTRLISFPTVAIKSLSDIITLREIYTVGYPKSLSLASNFDYDRPLVRKGIVSGIDLQKRKIIGDLPVYQGNSGGVVFEFSFLEPSPKIIGVVSQFVPFQERWKNEAYNYYNTNVYNSGYAVIVPIDEVMRFINQLR